MSRVLLCGAFGQDNPGDDALLDAFTYSLRGHDTVVAADIPPVEGSFDVVAPRPRVLCRTLGAVDAVVVAGGTVFKSLHRSVPRHHLSLLSRTRLLVALAHARGIPVALVGVGAGELRTRNAARVARSIAGSVDLLVLRDEESAAVLGRIGAEGPFRVGADLAWTLPGLLEPAPPAPRERGHVLVALSHLAGDDEEVLAARVARIVEPLRGRGYAVHLQPWQSGAADASLATRVVEQLGPTRGVEIVERPSTLHDAVRQASDASAVVALRYHALVAAGAAGRPVFALSHEPKLAGLARRLGQRWTPPHASDAVLSRAARELLDQAPPSRRAVRREVDAATRSMDLLRVVVSGGEDDDLLDRERLAFTTEGAPW